MKKDLKKNLIGTKHKSIFYLCLLLICWADWLNLSRSLIFSTLFTLQESQALSYRLLKYFSKGLINSDVFTIFFFLKQLSFCLNSNSLELLWFKVDLWVALISLCSAETGLNHPEVRVFGPLPASRNVLDKVWLSRALVCSASLWQSAGSLIPEKGLSSLSTLIHLVKPIKSPRYHVSPVAVAVSSCQVTPRNLLLRYSDVFTLSDLSFYAMFGGFCPLVCFFIRRVQQ